MQHQPDDGRVVVFDRPRATPSRRSCRSRSPPSRPGSDAVGAVTVQVDVNAINKAVAGTAVPHRTDKP